MMLSHFAKHWESGESFTEDLEGLKKFSANTFNLFDLEGSTVDFIGIKVT